MTDAYDTQANILAVLSRTPPFLTLISPTILPVKKEKRHRNEVMARQFRKPTLGRFRGGRGRGGGRAASSAQDEADSEWLDQIYGQHTIYRRDQNMAVGKTVAPKEEEANA